MLCTSWHVLVCPYFRFTLWRFPQTSFVFDSSNWWWWWCLANTTCFTILITDFAVLLCTFHCFVFRCTKPVYNSLLQLTETITMNFRTLLNSSVARIFNYPLFLTKDACFWHFVNKIKWLPLDTIVDFIFLISLTYSSGWVTKAFGSHNQYFPGPNLYLYIAIIDNSGISLTETFYGK